MQYDHTAKVQNTSLGSALGAVSGYPAQSAEARKPEIESMVDLLRGETNLLLEAIEMIESRFARVMQPAPGMNQLGSGSDTAAPYYCGLGSDIGDQIGRIRSARFRLESITQRAEV